MEVLADFKTNRLTAYSCLDFHWNQWLGDLGDGVHDGGPEDPRIVLLRGYHFNQNVYLSPSNTPEHLFRSLVIFFSSLSDLLLSNLSITFARSKRVRANGSNLLSQHCNESRNPPRNGQELRYRRHTFDCKTGSFERGGIGEGGVGIEGGERKGRLIKVLFLRRRARETAMAWPPKVLNTYSFSSSFLAKLSTFEDIGQHRRHEKG